MPARINLFSAPLTGPSPSEAGIFTWDIQKDLVFADAALAELFGLDPGEAAKGLPLNDYLERVHPADRPSLAKSISTALIADIPQQSVYRVLGGDDPRYQSVAAFGRAFRDQTATPIFYAGIVVAAETIAAESE